MVVVAAAAELVTLLVAVAQEAMGVRRAVQLIRAVARQMVEVVVRAAPAAIQRAVEPQVRVALAVTAELAQVQPTQQMAVHQMQREGAVVVAAMVEMHKEAVLREMAEAAQLAVALTPIHKPIQVLMQVPEQLVAREGAAVQVVMALVPMQLAVMGGLVRSAATQMLMRMLMAAVLQVQTRLAAMGEMVAQVAMAGPREPQKQMASLLR